MLKTTISALPRGTNLDLKILAGSTSERKTIPPSTTRLSKNAKENPYANTFRTSMNLISPSQLGRKKNAVYSIQLNTINNIIEYTGRISCRVGSFDFMYCFIILKGIIKKAKRIETLQFSHNLRNLK
jgi:hypothetical protein